MFSIVTPKKGTSAYLWISVTIDGIAPSIERIISDTYAVLTPIKYIVEAKGCIILDAKNVKNTRKGQQREVWGSKDTNHGGKRLRMLSEDDYGALLKKKMHKDAHGAK